MDRAAFSEEACQEATWGGEEETGEQVLEEVYMKLTTRHRPHCSPGAPQVPVLSPTGGALALHSSRI